MTNTLITGILEEHAEEAAFLWQQRTEAAHAPHYTLSSLADLDERIEAHLDGLRIGAVRSWDIATAALNFETDSEAFVFTHIAYHNADADQIAEVIDAVKSSGLHKGLISALGWMPLETARPIFQQLVNSSDEAECAMGLGGMSLHREEPASGLAGFLNDNRVTVARRAVRMAGELGRQDLLPSIKQHFSAEDADLRFWALWSAALLGDSAALDGLKVFGDIEPYALCVLNIALRRLPTVIATQWLEELAQDENKIRAVIQGAGISGNPYFIPLLLQMMTVPALARLAGEAFTLITGVDLSIGLTGASAFSDQEIDDAVAVDPDETLVWPNAEQVAEVWLKIQNRFQTGMRYFMGQPASAEQARKILYVGTQRQRAAAALELVVLQPGAQLFDVETPGFRQQQYLCTP